MTTDSLILLAAIVFPYIQRKIRPAQKYENKN